MAAKPVLQTFRRVSQYRDESKDWRKLHNGPLACLDFDLHLRFGLSLYEALNWADEKWHALVRSGKEEYSEKAVRQLRKAYADWHAPCEYLLKALKYFEDLGYKVEQAEAFRTACREVAGILTDDEDFFADEALVQARDDAIDAFRRGECEPM